MNDTLKVAGRIGAELGAAKAENEKLRGLLERIRTTCCQVRDAQDLDTAPGLSAAESLHEQIEKLDAALSQQAEPKCEICEGKGSVERDDKEARARYGGSWGRCLRCRPYKMAEPAPAQDELLPCPFCGRPAATAGKKATRFPWFKKVACSNDGCGAHFAYWHPDEWNRRAAPIGQTATQPERDDAMGAIQVPVAYWDDSLIAHHRAQGEGK